MNVNKVVSRSIVYHKYNSNNFKQLLRAEQFPNKRPKRTGKSYFKTTQFTQMLRFTAST